MRSRSGALADLVESIGRSIAITGGAISVSTSSRRGAADIDDVTLARHGDDRCRQAEDQSGP
jgi:hypothetical protein